jgi:hypothetical protein
VENFATGINNTSGKFCHWYQRHRRQILTPELTTPAANFTTSSACVVDTGGKFATTLNCKYLRKFSKKFVMALMVYSGAWGKLIHKKTRS